VGSGCAANSNNAFTGWMVAFCQHMDGGRGVGGRGPEHICDRLLAVPMMSLTSSCAQCSLLRVRMRGCGTVLLALARVPVLLMRALRCGRVLVALVVVV
jgi:hypothetical protein